MAKDNVRWIDVLAWFVAVAALATMITAIVVYVALPLMAVPPVVLDDVRGLW